jgi:ketosteroid isomerase-like protein
MPRMPVHPHEVIAQELWRAVSTSNVDALGRLFADDLVWHASGRGSRSGTFRGREAVLDYLARIGEDAERFDSALLDVLVGTDHTALITRVTAKRGDKKLETGFVLLLRIENASVAEVWAVPRDQLAIDEFWSE